MSAQLKPEAEPVVGPLQPLPAPEAADVPPGLPPPRHRSGGERLLDGAAGLAAAAMLAVVLVQVVGRLRGTPVPWSEELTRACFIWMMFLGLAGSMRAADVARVSVLAELVPALRRLALVVYVGGCLGFFALMGWTGWRMVQQQWAMNETIATLGLPSWVVGVVMPVSALLAAWGTLASLADHRAEIALDPPAAALSPQPAVGLAAGGVR